MESRQRHATGITVVVAVGVLLGTVAMGGAQGLLIWIGLMAAGFIFAFPRAAVLLLLIMMPLDVHVPSGFVLDAALDPARLLVVASVLMRARWRREVRISKGVTLLAVAYVLAVCASLIYAQITPALGVPYESVRYLYKLVTYVAFGYVAVIVIRESGLLRLAFWALLFGLIATDVYAIYQMAIGDFGIIFRLEYPLSINQPWIGRPTGLLSHPNNLAGYINLLLPIVAAVGIYVREFRVRAAAIGAICLSVAALFLTQSRGAWVAALLILSVLVFRVASKGLRVPLGILMALSAFALAFVVPATSARIQDASVSLNSRLEIWNVFKTMFLSSPVFGVGFGSYGVRFSAASSLFFDPNGPPIHAHDLYLQTLAETGVMGCLALLALLIAATRGSWALQRIARNRGLPLVAGFYLGLSLSIVGLLIHGLVDVLPESSPQFAALMWILVLLSAGTQIRPERVAISFADADVREPTEEGKAVGVLTPGWLPGFDRKGNQMKCSLWRRVTSAQFRDERPGFWESSTRAALVVRC